MDDVSYKGVKAHNLEVKMVSDGAVAEGNVLAPGKWLDLNCDFSFTNTSEMQKMKVKPKLKVHDVVNKEKVKAIGEKLKPKNVIEKVKEKKLGKAISNLFKKKKKKDKDDDDDD